ncbi:MAG: sigma factor-like helix-turn-helix DNA-binding protein [Candidatus Limnocylindrales bacterium]
MTGSLGLVLFGDVVESRRDSAGSTAWLRDLVAELDDAYAEQRLAAFGSTQGDEVEGLLLPGADPLTAVLRAALTPGGRRMRWVVVRGEVDPDATGGKVPATERTGAAFVKARAAMDGARGSHERLVILTGEAGVDALLANLAPALVDLLDGLTERQRTVARLALIDDLRQSEVADRLRIRRATVSVAFSRARVRSLQRFMAGMRLVYAGDGADAMPRATAPEPPPTLTE